MPRYPEIFRSVGVEGEVHLRYVVDTDGRISVPSLEVLRSTHEIFTTAVKRATALQRFEPPRRAGVATSVAVEAVVMFVNPIPDWKPNRKVQVTRDSIDAIDRPVTIVSGSAPRDSTKAPVLAGADSLEIYELVTEELMRLETVWKPPATWCVDLVGRVPPDDMVARWRRGERRVFAMADCPRTYASMAPGPSDPKPPPGWIDPLHIRIDDLAGWAEDMALVTARTYQGHSGRTSKCLVTREAGKWTQVFCVETQQSWS